MKVLTKQKIQELKEKYGTFYELEGEDGKGALITDPVSSLQVMKKAFQSLQKSETLFVESILNDCWIEGDEELKDDAHLQGLLDQINDITEIPECDVQREDNKYLLTCEGYQVEVRAAKRADIIAAEQKNAAKEPFDTSVYLLEKIALNPDQVKDIRKNATPVYIGLLAGIDKVKDKAVVSVKKH